MSNSNERKRAWVKDRSLEERCAGAITHPFEVFLGEDEFIRCFRNGESAESLCKTLNAWAFPESEMTVEEACSFIAECLGSDCVEIMRGWLWIENPESADTCLDAAECLKAAECLRVIGEGLGK